jgi:hypothetical protein
LEPSNDAAVGLPVGSAVVNTAGGLGGPRGATRGHERLVRFPDPCDAPEHVEQLRQRLWAARPERATPPVVFAGWARPRLSNDPRYRAALAGRSGGPAALLGRAVDLPRSTVAVTLGPVAGRNLAVLGSTSDAANLLTIAARSVAAHHPPGGARFVVAALAADAVPVAEALAADLARQHRVDRVDLPGLRAALAADAAGYLVVFGLDVSDSADLPADRLRALLREGPPTGRHLLAWWRSVPPFAALAEPEDEIGKLAAVVAVDVPGAQLATLFGHPVQWRPRAGRAMLWDGCEEQGVLFVPFAGPGEEEP